MTAPSEPGQFSAVTGSHVQVMQEAAHDNTFDYRAGSPHLSHPRLHDRLVDLLHTSLQVMRAKGLPPTVLEIGAGHGGYTEPVLAYGYEVTATEMSRPSLDHLKLRYGANERFRPLFDPDSSLQVLGDQRYACLLCVSVLHHIPDYMSFIRHAIADHLLPGGTFLSLQDPLWYPRMGRSTLLFSKFAFYTWRLTRGNYRRAPHTLLRAVRRKYDENSPADMVEYHVVRSGVNEEQIVDLLRPQFESVSLLPYWSTQARLWQRVGEAARVKNTFAIHATNYSGAARTR